MHKSSKDTNRGTTRNDDTKDSLLFLSETAASSSAPPTTASSSVHTTPTTTATASGLILLPVLGLGGVIDEEGIERQRVWEDKVADVVAANGKRVEGGGLAVARGHLYGFQMGVHLHVDAWKKG